MGKVLADRFELLMEAARGGMGSVYRGRDMKTGQTVAVKVLTLHSNSDQMRFEREASLLAQLHHANIVRYVTHGATDEGMRYLVQEWVDGITLSTQLQTIGATAEDAVRIAIGVAEALGAAHDHGVVHRDVKPANIILDAGDPDRVKLVDFGIARMEADAGVLTRAGVLVGTPSYMAPEQAKGFTTITPAADVWALGCVLYEAIAGRKAFAGRTPEAIRAKALLHEPERLDIICPEVLPELSAYVHQMISKRFEDRPQSGSEVSQQLRRLLPLVQPGPLRKTGEGEKAQTQVMPRKAAGSQSGSSSQSGSKSGAKHEAKCYVMLTVPPVEPGEAPRPPVNIEEIAKRHNMTIHPLDDHSVILEAVARGEVGAVSSAYAAMELQQHVFDGAVSVFGEAYDEDAGGAIDRGADALADATMANLFAESVGAEPIIPVDDVIADLIANEGLTIVTTEAGQSLQAPRAQTGTS